MTASVSASTTKKIAVARVQAIHASFHDAASPQTLPRAKPLAM